MQFELENPNHGLISGNHSWRWAVSKTVRESSEGHLSNLTVRAFHLFVNRIFDPSLCSAYHERSLSAQRGLRFALKSAAEVGPSTDERTRHGGYAIRAAFHYRIVNEKHDQ